MPRADWSPQREPRISSHKLCRLGIVCKNYVILDKNGIWGVLTVLTPESDTTLPIARVYELVRSVWDGGPPTLRRHRPCVPLMDRDWLRALHTDSRTPLPLHAVWWRWGPIHTTCLMSNHATMSQGLLCYVMGQNIPYKRISESQWQRLAIRKQPAERSHCLHPHKSSCSIHILHAIIHDEIIVCEQKFVKNRSKLLVSYRRGGCARI